MDSRHPGVKILEDGARWQKTCTLLPRRPRVWEDSDYLWFQTPDFKSWLILDRSRVIDDLECHLQSQKADVGLGYVYCDYRDPRAQMVQNLLGALLITLLQPNAPRIPIDIMKAYLKVQKPTYAEILVLLKSTIFQFKRVFICIDGLDELNNLTQLLRHFRITPGLNQPGMLLSISLFFTGRNSVRNELNINFPQHADNKAEAHESNLRAYLSNVLDADQHRLGSLMNSKLRDEGSHDRHSQSI